jgi:hypothetical protein
MTSVLAFVLFGSAVAIGCSSSNNNGGGGGSSGGGGGGACTETTNGSVVGCFSWGGGLTSAETDAFCPTTQSTSSVTYATVGSCPTTNAVGTCAYKYTAGSESYSYSETYYGVNGVTCAAIKSACDSATVSGSIATTFSGDGC